VALATLLLAGFAGHLVAGRLLRPLSQLREATAGIDTEDLTRRVEISSADNDVAQLSLNFNQMLDRLEAGFADQRQFLDDAAHELRTPLTIIRGNLELMAAEDAADVEQTRELVLDELDRMKRLVDDLLLLAKSQRPDFVRMQPVDVTELAGELKDRVHLLGERQWEASGTATGEVMADRQRLQQAVVQLAANAVKFTGPDDRIELGVDWSPPTASVREQVEDPAGRYLVITVRDTGTGIDPDESERIFDRFARGDNVQGVEGSGLGLAIVQAIVRAHHGAVTVDSLPGRGSTFRLWIPDQGAII
jgi:signal transduction histidine kinase